MSDQLARYRCPSINPFDIGDRCKLADDDEHEYGHEGFIKGRSVTWDISHISIPENTPERWEKEAVSDD